MQKTTTWRIDRPSEGFYQSALPSDPLRNVCTFLPENYQPRYAYPLLVMFHGQGGNEEQVLRMAPQFSRRNYIAISLRGPNAIGSRADKTPACSWEGATTEQIVDAIYAAVQQTRRSYHIHSERVYLVGVNEGASAAYRGAFTLGEQIAGVIAMNGNVPKSTSKTPLFRFDQIRKQKVFIAQSTANPVASAMEALRDQKLFYAAGAEVKFTRFRSASRLPGAMFQDVNRWIISQINASAEVLVPS
jgi:phospholipase/carboxylesterase